MDRERPHICARRTVRDSDSLRAYILSKEEIEQTAVLG